MEGKPLRIASGWLEQLRRDKQQDTVCFATQAPAAPNVIISSKRNLILKWWCARGGGGGVVVSSLLDLRKLKHVPALISHFIFM